ncbi:flagellar hook-basal body complex protein [Roseomonas elaeocarpi]|uniref:Flagellar hook-basal body complex protein n=1 Tax=Roseomonas elaeocarpi TaxID=907779 RepID=A0ABV6JP75_9PROT
MDNAGYIALSRLAAQARATEVLANNMANADTPGFQAVRPIFASFMDRQHDVDAPASGQSMAMSWDRATWRDEAAGPIQTTGNPLDVAISGEGFFALQTPKGERYTRAGRFTLGQDGTVMDADGNALMGTTGAPLQVGVGDTRLTISGEGVLSSENGEIGRIRVVRFADGQKPRAEGDRLLSTEDPPEEMARPALVQGAVEGSNVKPILEMTRLTDTQREFEFAAQFVEREDQRIRDAVDRIMKRS